ncbi:MAG: hypothetical protein OXB84_07530 [Halobacteriovoraceae bacterium]|nr:hypothetical protein [Halobacteriovoraceae bacterium]
MKILIVLFFINSHLSAKSYYGMNVLPTELNLLLLSLAKNKLDRQEQKSLKEIIFKIDHHFSDLKKEEAFFLVKSTIYKTILEYRKKTGGNIIPLTPLKMQELIEEKLKDLHYSEFTKWLLKAILSDYKNIYKSKNQKISYGDRKKLRMIIPWYNHFINISAEEFELDLKQLHFSILKKISLATGGLLRYSRFDYKEETPEKLKFFELRDPTPMIEPDTVENLLGTIPTRPLQAPLKQHPAWEPRNDQTDNFLLKDPDYTKPQILPEPVDEALWAKEGDIDPNYIPPKELPRPINEKLWAKEGGIDPNYIPPKELPAPVEEDSWNEE